MKIHNLKLTTLEIVTENGAVVTQTLTPTEFAGLKRSKQWKRKITFKKLCEIEIKTKTL